MILCGWTHAVQQRDITDLAIRKKLTLLAWDEMNIENKHGKLHIFYRNNELAGYAGVLHFLELKGMDGHYGPRKNVVILGYGSVSRGAIYALQGRGFNNITVYDTAIQSDGKILVEESLNSYAETNGGTSDQNGNSVSLIKSYVYKFKPNFKIYNVNKIVICKGIYLSKI